MRPVFFRFKKDTLDVCRYFFQDYQGNNRVLIGTNGKLDQLSHYYLYGSLMDDLGTKDPHSYKYGGEELDRDLVMTCPKNAQNDAGNGKSYDINFYGTNKLRRKK